MRFKLFDQIKPDSVLNTAGPILFCVAALAATIWSLKDLAEDPDTTQFILDSLTDQMDRHGIDNDCDKLYIASGLGS